MRIQYDKYLRSVYWNTLRTMEQSKMILSVSRTHGVRRLLNSRAKLFARPISSIQACQRWRLVEPRMSEMMGLVLQRNRFEQQRDWHNLVYYREWVVAQSIPLLPASLSELAVGCAVEGCVTSRDGVYPKPLSNYVIRVTCRSEINDIIRKPLNQVLKFKWIESTPYYQFSIHFCDVLNV